MWSSVCSAPGPVGHLSFTEILDTSLKVSWKDPLEKNGILTGIWAPPLAISPDLLAVCWTTFCLVPAGYRISWEEFNRTNTRVTHYLPNITQEYRVTGLTALTTYTIQVASMTSKGQGHLSSSTISSGVPPGEFLLMFSLTWELQWCSHVCHHSLAKMSSSFLYYIIMIKNYMMAVIIWKHTNYNLEGLYNLHN